MKLNLVKRGRGVPAIVTVRTVTRILALLAVASASRAYAQPFMIPWYTMDGGGGTSTGGTFELSGTIGQPDAGVLSGGNFELSGGFWYPAPADCVAPDFAPGAAGVPFTSGVVNGYIDPRRESNNGVNLNQGLTDITIKFTTPMENSNGAALTADRFSITDTLGNPPAISSIMSADGQTVTVHLDRIISLQAWTTITVSNVRDACGHTPFTGSVDIGFLPADVTQNRVVNPLDLLEFKQYVNGLDSPAVGTLQDYIDINRSGGPINPLDLLAFKQLINGLPPSTQSWQGKTLPLQP